MVVKDIKTIKQRPINFNQFFRFVGEYVYFDDSRSPQNINELKNALKL